MSEENEIKLNEKVMEEVWVHLRLYEEFNRKEHFQLFVKTLTKIVDSMGLGKSSIYPDARSQTTHLFIQAMALEKLAGYILADEDEKRTEQKIAKEMTARWNK